MSDLKTKRSIQEFWIDFLIEEELSCNKEFARAFLDRCGFTDATVKTVLHSQSDEFGETDVFVLCVKSDGQVGVLLIEDKITASFQTDQAKRYRMRGMSGVQGGQWATFKTVLLAPSKYIGASDHGFDEAIALEEVSDWICSDDSARGAFKRSRLQKAIDKKTASGVQIVDEEMTEYRRRYTDRIIAYNAEFGTGFIPPIPRLAWWGDDWVQWVSEHLPSQCKFRHMSRTGIMEIGFQSLSRDAAEPILPYLSSSMKLVATGRHKQHSAIQISIKPITDFCDCPESAETVGKALECAKELQDLVLARREIIDRLLQGTRRI